jgi:hypothetical protein
MHHVPVLMWQSYALALIVAVALAGLSFGIAYGMVRFGERAIEKRQGVAGLGDMIARRARLEMGLAARRTARLAELQRLEDDLRMVTRRRSRLKREVKDVLTIGDHRVRLIGEETRGTPCFFAQVINKYVGTGNQHALIDPTWSEPQTLEVWTRSVHDARREIENRYPPAFGFVIMRLTDVRTPASGNAGVR